MDTMNGNWASSRVYLGYTELFCIPQVTAMFLSSCDRGLGDSLLFHQALEAPYVFEWEHGIALHPMQGIWASSPDEWDVSWKFSSCGRNLGYILELQQGWQFETTLCSANSGVLVVSTNTSVT